MARASFTIFSVATMATLVDIRVASAYLSVHFHFIQIRNCLFVQTEFFDLLFHRLVNFDFIISTVVTGIVARAGVTIFFGLFTTIPL